MSSHSSSSVVVDNCCPSQMTTSSSPAAFRSSALAFLQFLNKSVTPFHAVESVEAILKSANFVQKSEYDKLQIQPKDRFYVKKSETSIFAFAAGGAFKPSEAGFSIVVAHTDSPCLRIKPVSKKTSEQFLQVGVSLYGGGLWRTWFDRDLSTAGQVLFRESADADAPIRHKLVDLRRPLFHIPSLAIHLDSDPSKFELNKEVHLTPLMAHAAICEANGGGGEQKQPKKEDGGGTTEANNCQRFVEEHHPQLLEAIAAAAGCKTEQILDMDMFLYDTQPATLSGLNEEFISGARLDNLVSTYTAIKGLVESLEDTDAFDTDSNVRMVACFDNEEVGSRSAQGAQSHCFEWLLRRILSTVDHPTAFECSIGRSFMVSADQAHSVHPNYAHKHEERHKPSFHRGVVVKVNANQNYATTAVTHSVLKVIADSVGVPLQKVVVRNDSRCGSTVGPILAAKLGIQTIDVGCPQLAMHSIREIGDVSSIAHSIRLFSGFFSKLPKVLKELKKAEQ
ncbi:hypothetical protein niasHT_005418 [Heterodera trifolii]|uniref:Aspartyl aminopeptidase n=1 Tax=Heterodera trifolii TaxID=157864 RepID=A0ABD2MG41_9BILA